jgi:hypothetical protein
MSGQTVAQRWLEVQDWPTVTLLTIHSWFVFSNAPVEANEEQSQTWS